ncbi:hypothetical protein PISMIDRAFT_330220 [Pisolithus microcarpus 441]|uniref:Uncharacterized protein n=1 Tax=Pisolithus microcarpus 441 TaxID=765257 RepID=A0A0C9Z5B0_9AGAM|nr:hypothetical protein BKA83DRAFT_330220 [Pisolithus microcarpus]KIK15188.1 hypothetical protein PISMIDRAFT_330220 [Pisolithus microcarpus 441]
MMLHISLPRTIRRSSSITVKSIGKFSKQYFREQWKTVPIYSSDVGSKAVMVVGSNVGLVSRRPFTWRESNLGR